MKKRRIIPFSLFPGSWGLSGNTRKIAKAEYEYSGEDLERELIKINHENDKTKQEIENISLDVKYNKISEYEGALKKAKLLYADEKQYNIEILEIEYMYKKISKLEYEKKLATEKHEPWVGTIKSEFNRKMGKDGFSFELDWNEFFIDMLIKHGYEGSTEGDIVEQWFEDINQSTFMSLLEDDYNDTDVDHTIPLTRTHEETFKDDSGSEKKRYS